MRGGGWGGGLGLEGLGGWGWATGVGGGREVGVLGWGWVVLECRQWAGVGGGGGLGFQVLNLLFLGRGGWGLVESHGRLLQPLTHYSGKGDFSLLKYSSPVVGCPAGKGVCVGKAPSGVVGFGTSMT